MKNEIKICDKCEYININTIVPKIKQLDDTCDIKIGCCNFCGMCKTSAFLIKNGIPITAKNEDLLIEKLKSN